MRRSLLRAILTVGLLGGLTLSSLHAANAAEDPEALIKQGVELRRQGKDATAEGYFRRAYQLAATPRTAAQLGLVEMAVKNYVDAEGHLSEALRGKDSWINEHRRALEDSLSIAHKNMFRVELPGAPRGTTAAVEGGEPRPLPADGLLWIAPGAAVTIALEAPGHKSAEVRALGPAGESRRYALDMPAAQRVPTAPPPVPAPVMTPPPLAVTPTPPEPTPPEATPSDRPARPGRALRIAGLSVGAVGVVTGVVGAVVLAKGESKRDALAKELNSNGAVKYDPSNQNWETLRTTGIACLVGGGVALAGGVGLYVLGVRSGNQADKPEGQQASSVSFITGPGFGFMSFRRSF